MGLTVFQRLMNQPALVGVRAQEANDEQSSGRFVFPVFGSVCHDVLHGIKLLQKPLSSLHPSSSGFMFVRGHEMDQIRI